MKEVLTKEGLIVYDITKPTTTRYTREETVALKGDMHFENLGYHCEVAHIELTSKCNRSCSYCYNPKDADDMTLGDFKGVIDKLADYGVFQITFGGGEPFCEMDKLAELVPYAKEKGLAVCVTTNGDALADATLEGVMPILENVDQINLSYHGSGFWGNLGKILMKRHKFPFRLGINYCMFSYRITSREIDKITDVCAENDISITMLAYKDVKGSGTGEPPVSVLGVSAAIFENYGGRLNVSVDASCVDRCMASKRFVDIHPDGEVSVCSFKRESIGNIRTGNFKRIWGARPRYIKCPYFDVNNGEG